MLDATTKRKIDSARDILVGKVPDPKQQVDQITNALIYKFMDDMDKEAQELGGKAKFFTGDFIKYSWTKLLDKRFSGQERLDLYVQAIANMPKNPHIPQLFRDIFKDAFLPYRDPETLSLFFKEIDGFTYNHSEDLGNAFEYLLSVLGSQGDAGQFRTPRHIIDFIVAVVDPKKNETILDPACGTAGFLISAYKHILHDHDGLDNKTGKPTDTEKPLTPDERKKLMNNFVGYDISPDMVKLSLVNMYLHGFQKPKIYEYDTLTSEKHWEEQFDVIMANPPFMSPKGGIRPHKRFSVQAKRSEVLFVDYILEHLNLKGRAGIIVPEGIIFKSENAYKRLRQMLVENGLFAVVSLPPGVFNPYSGVKTSILLFDNQLAKKTDEILFLKIENDGFDLGAQRRKIDKNDLTEALEILEAWKKGKKKESNLALWVKKEKIAESGDYNLTGERYREVEVRKNQKWPMVELGEVCEIVSGGGFPKKEQGLTDVGIPFLKVSDMNIDGNGVYIKKWNNTVSRHTLKKLRVKSYPAGTVIFPKIGAAIATNKKRILTKESAFDNNVMGLVPSEKILSKYLYALLLRVDLSIWASNATPPSMRKTVVEKYKIPLPPLEVQKEIVEQIEVKQNAINSAREIIKNLERERRYFGEELRGLDDVEWVELGELFEKVNDQIDPKKETGNIVYVGLENIESDTGRLVGEVQAEISTIKSLKKKFSAGDILFGKLRPNLNKVWYADRAGICSTDIFVLRSHDERVLPKLYSLILRGDGFVQQVMNGLKGAQLPRVGFDYLSKIKIPLPPLKIQKQLVAEAEKEEEIIVANRRLIDIMERKIEKVLEEI